MMKKPFGRPATNVNHAFLFSLGRQHGQRFHIRIAPTLEKRDKKNKENEEQALAFTFVR